MLLLLSGKISAAGTSGNAQKFVEVVQNPLGHLGGVPGQDMSSRGFRGMQGCPLQGSPLPEIIGGPDGGLGCSFHGVGWGWLLADGCWVLG